MTIYSISNRLMKSDGKILILESEMETVEEINFSIDSLDILQDLKIIMSDYYVATFNELGTSLKLCFNNGQKFKISVDTCE